MIIMNTLCICDVELKDFLMLQAREVNEKQYLGGYNAAERMTRKPAAALQWPEEELQFQVFVRVFRFYMKA